MADKIKKTKTTKTGGQKPSTAPSKKTKTPATDAKGKNVNKKAGKKPRVKSPGVKKASPSKKTTPVAVLESNENKEITIRGKKRQSEDTRTDALPVKKTNDKNSAKALTRAKKKAPEENLPATVEDEIDPEALHRGDMPMSLVDHLEEFRSRILVILGTLIVLTAVGISFSDYLIEFINRPFPTSQKLHVFKLLGGFLIRLKASAVVALLLTIPLIFYHAWKFIVPAINKEDRMFSRMTLLAAILLFYGGMAFVFFGLIPFVLQILIQFIPPDMQSTIGADDYLSFILLFSLAMGFLFELPIAVLILTRMGLLTPQFLIAKRKIAIVLCFLIGGIITPQDPFSMFFVAVPLWFLYEISIFVSRFVLVRKKKRELRNQN
ncbi:MAG: twin-arginine translocase subunit TatC [Spirochaetae bacterium HGW-Spirochaetae-1]|nr:MAG: twin-arginine translocase subunit TatC [Spirochaetae bacterium HGW-Spirochaetae-1]